MLCRALSNRSPSAPRHLSARRAPARHCLSPMRARRPFPPLSFLTTTTWGNAMNKLLAAGALICAPLTAAASCGSAFCTINTSWDAHGAWLEPGARLDLRYEYIRQDQPRSGTRDLAVGEIRRHHDEVLTVNRNLLGTFDYTFNQDWGANVLVPLVDREHDHIHNHMGAQLPEHWDFRELGDVRVMARRRLFTSENTDSHSIGTAGLYFGLKLPTGKTDVKNADGDAAE